MRRRLNTKQHIAWRKAVLERDGGCVICNKAEKNFFYCNVHHLVPSEFHKYEFDETNGIALCPMHHTLGKFSAHKNPLWFYEWMLENRIKQLEIALQRLNEV